MADTTTTTDAAPQRALRHRAAEAAAAADAEEAQKQASLMVRAKESTRSKLAKALELAGLADEELVVAEGELAESLMVRVGGISLRFRNGWPSGYLEQLIPCSECENPAGHRVDSLADLGRALAERERLCGTCSEPLKPEPFVVQPVPLAELEGMLLHLGEQRYRLEVHRPEVGTDKWVVIGRQPRQVPYPDDDEEPF